MRTPAKALLSLALFTAALLVAPVQAQVVLTFEPDSKLWIEGTSNKSDWTVNATKVDGQVTMKEKPTARALAVQSVRMTVPSKDIKSGKSTIMDRLMHETLMVEEHPQITYALKSAEVAPGEGNTVVLKTKGDLTLTGTTREVALDVAGTLLADGKVRFTGTHAFKMSDFGITPPSAMFGALRTADDITVHFDLVTAPKQAN